jgi:hypothetical protein
MNIKKSLIWGCLGAFLFGLVVTFLGLYAATQDEWYRNVTNTPRYRAMIIDKLAENTVTVYEITSSGRDAKIRVTEEP